MTEYTLEELLDEHLPRTGQRISLSPPSAQLERTTWYALRSDRITIRDGLNPWNGDKGSGTLDRFDIRTGAQTQHLWWIPGLTRAQHQTYQTLRADGMRPAQAKDTVDALEALEALEET